MFLLLFTFLIQPASADTFKETLEKWHHEAINYRRAGAPLEKDQILREFYSPFLKDKIEVAINVQDRKKDLVVVLPGLFGGYDSAENLRVAQLIAGQGFNILRIPNPVSSHVIKLSPKYAPLDFETEGKMIADLIHQVQAGYGFPKIHLAGSSYGAFIAAVASVQLGAEFNGKLFMVSPPKNIYGSLKKVDAYFDEMQGDFDKFPWDQILFFINTKWALFLKKDIKVTPQVAKETLIIYGFHKTFLGLADLKDPKPWWRFYENWLPATRRKQNEMRFIPYLQQSNPEFFSRTQEHEVLYWAQKTGRPWELTTSNDDFINPPEVWPALPQIKIFAAGGHVFGYMEDPVFLKILSEYF